MGIEFVGDVLEIRKQARERMAESAVASGPDPNQVIKVLNEVLATELICALRYERHYHVAEALDSESVKREFLKHAADEQAHAHEVAERITQLGGRPDFNPETLVKRSHAKDADGETLRAMLKENLVAERIAIATYTEIARWLSDKDPTSQRIIESILRKEEEHAEDLATLLGHIPDDIQS